ncbi:processed acidic surface protein [Bacillus sp. V59.32b]|uniref:processed acidic surface protein n=1 Tax=Bacillus sp. V59.32b TaxID=1758642 RepID=UPI000E3E8F8C|nr:processed acidic surface protein [Bacillus sp. V59.32b]RFU68180.1 processed acidic surface protein [Bacillus sp. V59.32b]
MRQIASILFALILLVSLLPKQSFAAQDPNFDADFQAYLEEISAIRGFEVTEADIAIALAEYDEVIKDYETVEELSDWLGEVIASDYSNIQDVLQENEMTMEDLDALLAENGEEIEDFIFVDDVLFYIEPDFDEEFMNELLMIFQEELDLTQQELENLNNHFMALEEELSTPEATAKFEQLAEKMEAFDEFETLDELTPEQVSEFIAIFDEMFTMLKIKPTFALIMDGKETTVSLWELFNMEELINAKLKVNIFDLEGNLLADLIITGDMVDNETINNIGNNLNTATEKVKQAKSENPKVKTEKGGKLPKTAGNYASGILIGLVMMLSGIMLYRNFRKTA